MKIVYISTSTIPSRTANSIHVMKMCAALSKNGHDVLLLHPINPLNRGSSTNDKFSYYGVDELFEIAEILSVRPNIDRYGKKSIDWVKKIGPDLVYGRSISGCYWATSIGVPTVFEAHAPIIKVHHRKFSKMISNPSFKKLVVISNALRDVFLDSYPELTGKIIVAHDGADVISFKGKNNIKYPKERLQVGYVGHLYPGRGVDIIIKLSERVSHMDFHVVGGTDKDISYYSDKLNDIENLFLHGYKKYKEAEEFRLSCDIFLAPYGRSVSVSGSKGNSVDWMSPLKIFEYMAAGKAILTSDLAVLKEILTDGENAILCNPDDLDDWVSKLNHLNSNQDEILRLGENALETLTKKYTWDIRAKDIIDNIEL